MTRRYRYAKPAERDARNERRQAAARAGIVRAHADLEIEPRDDLRQPWPLILGEWVRWEIRPYARNIRQWWAVDERGEPVRDDSGLVVGDVLHEPPPFSI